MISYIKNISYYYFFKQLGQWLINFMAIQCFVTLVSLPILIAWGLPLSIATPVGNIIFSPFLTAFLLFSSLIFITELIGIPNSILIYCLETIHSTWNYLLSYGTHAWLLYYKLPSYYILVILGCIPFIIILHKKTRVAHIAFISLCILISTTLALTYCPQEYAVHEIDCLGKSITLITSQRETILIDTGALGRKLSTPSWVEYTLIPLLAQEYGINTLDHVVLLKPGKMVFDAADTLCKHARVNNVYMITWNGDAQKNLLRSYFTLKKTIEQSSARLHRIGYRTTSLQLDEDHNVMFELTDSHGTYTTVSYPLMHTTYTT
jgi:hypothetical protein